MDFEELNNLISVRNYVANSINNNPSIDRPTLSELNGMLILIDRKILDVLKDKDFKDYIGYQGVKQAIAEVARLNDIKSGLKK